MGHEAARLMLTERICQNPACALPFTPQNPNGHNQRYCPECRSARRTMPPKPPARPLRCKWCRGSHLTDHCPNPNGRRPVRKLYGTMGPRREYVPPPGVSVRIIEAPYALCGDQLDAWLNQREGR